MKLSNEEMERENEFVGGCVLFPVVAICWTLIICLIKLLGFDFQKFFENDNGIKMGLLIFSYYVVYKIVVIALRRID